MAKVFIHPTALVATDDIGADTRVWAFCNIMADVRIGEDCNICDHCSIECNVVVGNRVTVKNGVSLWDGMSIEDDVFIGPHAVFTNDVYPRSKAYLKHPVPTCIKRGASIGANAVVVAGHNIGEFALIGAGSVITKDVPSFTIWYGNPARMVGYVCQCARKLPVEVDVRNQDVIACTCGRTFVLRDGLLTATPDSE